MPMTERQTKELQALRRLKELAELRKLKNGKAKPSLLENIGTAATLATRDVNKFNPVTTGAASTLFKGAQKGADIIGEKAAESLASGQALAPSLGGFGPLSLPTGQAGPKVKPEIAAAIGTAVQMAPELALTFGMPGSIELFSNVLGKKGLRSAVNAVKNMAKRTPKAVIPTEEELATGALKRLSRAKKGLETRQALPGQVIEKATEQKSLLDIAQKSREATLKSRQGAVTRGLKQRQENVAKPLREKISKLQEGKKRSEVGIAKKAQELEKAKVATGKEIRTAEKGANLDLGTKKTIQVERAVGKGPIAGLKRVKRMEKVISKGPEYIAKHIKPKNIQASRKIFEGVKENAITGEARETLRSAKDTFAQAARKVSSELDTALTKFNRISKEIEKLKAVKGTSSKAINAKIQEAKTELERAKAFMQDPKVAIKLKSQLGSLPSKIAKRKAELDLVINRAKAVLKKQVDKFKMTEGKLKLKESTLKAKASRARVEEKAKVDKRNSRLRKAAIVGASAIGGGKIAGFF